MSHDSAKAIVRESLILRRAVAVVDTSVDNTDTEVEGRRLSRTAKQHCERSRSAAEGHSWEEGPPSASIPSAAVPHFVANRSGTVGAAQVVRRGATRVEDAADAARSRPSQ